MKIVVITKKIHNIDEKEKLLEETESESSTEKQEDKSNFNSKRNYKNNDIFDYDEESEEL